jgi:hypothetical protein
MTDLWRVTTVFTGLPGLPGTNTLHANTTEQSASDFKTLVGEFWHTILTNDDSGSSGMASPLVATTLGQFDVIDSDTGQVTGTANAGDDVINNGNGTSEVLPYATQGLIRLVTTLFIGGRQLRGRIHIPGLTEDHSTNGVPNSSTLGVWNAAATTLSESSLAVYSPSKHQWADGGSGGAWNKFAVLRSRRD